MRILLDAPAPLLNATQALAVREGTSRSEIMRRALAAYVAANNPPAVVGFGLWAQIEPSALPIDGLAYQEALRAEWDDRPPT